ncbi:MAG: hypothetical protein U0350_40075 [Caldilineaceae bacterium]
MSQITFDSLYQQACNTLDNMREQAIVTYDEVFHPPDVFIMYVKMDHPGWDDKSIWAEARKRYNRHFGIQEGAHGQAGQ